jgi:hypothetical protein
MAAGLGFKTFNTGDVLSAADTNGYLMQGVLVFANATARDAAITSPQEGQFAFTKDNDSLWYYSGSAWVSSGATGDIEGVTAGVGISGGGTSGTVTVTNSMATEIDAKGDLIAGTGADTFARLAVGANDTVLTADSSTATGLKWAAAGGGGSGGLTLLDTLSLSGASTTSATFSSAYKYLILYVKQMYGSTTNALNMRLNGDSGNNYAFQLFTAGGSDTATATNKIRIATMSTNSATLERTYAIVQLWRPSDTDVVYVNSNQTCNSSTNPEFQTSIGLYDNSAAITSITILPGAGTMTAGTVYIYGGN